MDTGDASQLGRWVSKLGMAGVTPRLPRVRALVLPLLAFLTFRLATGILGVIANVGQSAHSSEAPRLLRPWLQWDVFWQVAIATRGYDAYSHVRVGANVYDGAAFQPILPGLMHVTSMVTGLTAYEAGLILCSVAVIIALIGVLRIAQEDLPKGVAGWALAAVLLFPTAVFLASVYTESLLLAEVVWAFIAVRRNHVGWSAVLVFAAVLTKAYAVVFVLPLAVEYCRQERRLHRRWVGVSLLAGGAVAGAAALAGYFAWLDHDPVRFITALGTWDHRPSFPWTAVLTELRAVIHPVNDDTDGLVAIVNVGLLALLCWTVWYAWRRQRPSHAVLAATLIVVFTTNGLLGSLGRYMLVCFPTYLALADVSARAHPRVRWAVTSAAALLAVLYAGLFAVGHWSG